MVKQDVLPNGVRVITESVPYVQSVSIGIWTDSGARDESSTNMGISHFIEHMLFKGTETRTAKKIADEFDSIGGQLNAFTEKEYTCYFAKVLSEHLPLAVEVLSDMMLNSVLDPQEMKLEKKVVLEEIKRHEDTPDDLVHDMFTQTVWMGHPLGNSILGTREAVSALTREDLVEFMKARYTPDSIVVSAAGNFAHEELVEQVRQRFGHLQGKQEATTHVAPSFVSGSKLTDKITEQVHFCIGTSGYSHLVPEKYPLAIIDATLGGGMSSRLFQEIRESRGLAYAIGSYSSSYREGGLFTVYGGTSPQHIEEVIDLVKAQFTSIWKDNITEEEMSRAKNQIRGSLVLSQESMSSRMIRMAKSHLYFGRVIPLEELMTAIMNVSHDDVAHVAEHIFGNVEFPIAAIGPFNGKNGVIE